jgi:TolB-like protein
MCLTVKHRLKAPKPTYPMNRFPDPLIAQALQKILASPSFAVSGILRRFLSFVVEETMNGRANQIKEYTIGVHVLDKPFGFNPQQDAIVRIHGGRLRRALHQYYMHDGADDPICIAIPKGGYVPVFESKKRAPEVSDLAAASEQLPSKKAVPRLRNTKKKDPRIVVAVMPFNHSEINPFNRVFAQNLVEQLNTDLSHFQEIQVIGQYCTNQFNSDKNSLHELRQVFAAQYVITGHVQASDLMIRCCVQLISTQSSEQVWSQVYNMELSNGGQLQVQDDIVKAILADLTGYYGVIIRDIARTSEIMHHRDSTQHESILWYYYFHAELTELAFGRTMHAMECAIRRNPLDAFAWAFLGELHMASFLFTHRVNTHASALGRRYAQKALAINPRSTIGYVTLGWANLFLGNQAASVEGFEKALGLTSYPTTNTGHIGFGLICTGNYEEGFKLVQKAIGLNLFYPRWFNLGISLYYFKLKNYTQAIEWASKVNYHSIAWDKIITASALAHLNRRKEAGHFVRKLVKQVPNLALLISHYERMLPFDPEIREDLHAGLRKASLVSYSVPPARAKKVAKSSVTYELN